MLDMLIVALGGAEILVAGIGLIVFAISYASFFNWKKTPAGRALMYFALSMIALFVDDLLSRLFGSTYLAREMYQLAVYTGVMLATWRLVWVLWREWLRSRHVEIERKDESEVLGKPQDGD